GPKPTMGGLLQYLEENSLPTLGGDGGGLSWRLLTDPVSGAKKAIEITFEDTFAYQASIGLDLGAGARNIGFVVDGDADVGLAVQADVKARLLFDWGGSGPVV